MSCRSTPRKVGQSAAEARVPKVSVNKSEASIDFMAMGTERCSGRVHASQDAIACAGRPQEQGQRQEFQIRMHWSQPDNPSAIKKAGVTSCHARLSFSL